MTYFKACCLQSYNQKLLKTLIYAVQEGINVPIKPQFDNFKHVNREAKIKEKQQLISKYHIQNRKSSINFSCEIVKLLYEIV